MTTLTFQASRSIGATLSPGDEIIVTILDHEANVSPWQLMAADRGAILRTIDVRADDGTLDLDDFDRKLTDRTKLVAIGYASNAIGTINPVAELVRRAHAAGALTYVDAVHYAPHGLLDVQALDADFLACSAYKFFGPHVGVLYGRSELFDRLPAYKVRPAHDRFQTGTQNFEGIAGTLAAIEYLAGIGVRYGEDDGPVSPDASSRRRALAMGMQAIRAHETALFRRLLDGLATIPGARVWGITEPARFGERTPTAAITFAGLSAGDAAAALGRRGITAWSGHFYAQALIERLGLADSGGVLRIGIAHYNTVEEVDRLLGELEWIAAGVPGTAVG
jgi:cysteine desulfurase family protein (TIGR01976 family)